MATAATTITTANWSTDSTGSSAATTFVSGDIAVFSAGTDGTGSFRSLTNSGTQTIGGMTNEEIAVALGTSPRTVKRDWVAARAWLHNYLFG